MHLVGLSVQVQQSDVCLICAGQHISALLLPVVCACVLVCETECTQSRPCSQHADVAVQPSVPLYSTLSAPS